MRGQSVPRPSDQQQEAALAAAHRETQRARAAVAASVDSVHTEALRLRDSREIADNLRRHIQENGFTERLAASMRLRERSQHA